MQLSLSLVSSVLSCAGLPMAEAVSALLSPAFELAGEAHRRPYLSARTLRASLEIVKTTLSLALKGAAPDSGCLQSSSLQRGIQLSVVGCCFLYRLLYLASPAHRTACVAKIPYLCSFQGAGSYGYWWESVYWEGRPGKTSGTPE